MKLNLALLSYRTCLRCLLLFIAVLSGCERNQQTELPVLNWYVFDERSGAFRDAVEHCSSVAEGRYRLELKPLPTDADQQREQLVRRLAAGDKTIDIVGMDVIWSAEFAQAGWILPWPTDSAVKATTGMLPAAVRTTRYRDTAYAIPFTSNAQLLWYRKDLVPKPPSTWDELIRQAARFNRPGALQVQGQRYEGLTVFFVSLLASAGGSVLNAKSDEVALPEAPTRQALSILKRIADSPAADPGLSSAREDQNRLAFESGQPVFMLNYSYVWPSAQQNAPAVAKNMAWARWPAIDKDQPSRVTIGGINLAVAAFSRYPELAFEAAGCLASAQNQIVAAQKGGMPPTLEALYANPAVRARFPMADTLLETLHNATQRPATPLYNDISLAISRSLHPYKDIDPTTDSEKLRAAVNRALKSEGLF